MSLHITKSKNAESFYICKSYVKANGSTTSAIVRKLGTLEQLLAEHGPTRDDVITWAKNEAKAETKKYKKEKEAKTVLIPFHADKQLVYCQIVNYGDLCYDKRKRKVSLWLEKEPTKFFYQMKIKKSSMLRFIIKKHAK